MTVDVPADTSEPDNPAAYALARHIADHPMSTVQAAFRYLNAPISFELHNDGLPDAPTELGTSAANANETTRHVGASSVGEPATVDDGLRERAVAALTAAAYQCDGDCGLNEHECFNSHPITWSGMVAGHTHVTGGAADIADAVLAVRDDELREARATNQRLNHRAQRAESGLTAVTRAVAEWKLGEHGTTYVPLRTLTAIARAVGRPVEAGRYELHYQRVERAEAAIARVRDLRERARTEAPMAQGPTWRGLDEALNGPQPTCTATFTEPFGERRTYRCALAAGHYSDTDDYPDWHRDRLPDPDSQPAEGSDATRWTDGAAGATPHTDAADLIPAEATADRVRRLVERVKPYLSAREQQVLDCQQQGGRTSGLVIPGVESADDSEPPVPCPACANARRLCYPLDVLPHRDCATALKAQEGSQ